MRRRAPFEAIDVLGVASRSFGGGGVRQTGGRHGRPRVPEAVAGVSHAQEARRLEAGVGSFLLCLTSRRFRTDTIYPPASPLRAPQTVRFPFLDEPPPSFASPSRWDPPISSRGSRLKDRQWFSGRWNASRAPSSLGFLRTGGARRFWDLHGQRIFCCST